MKVIRHPPVVIAAILFSAVLTMYLVTLCPTVYPGDNGELATAASLLQIAHPPGYPLLTLVGRIWTLLLFMFKPIFALNVLSAVVTASAAVIMYVILGMRQNGPTVVDRLAHAGMALLFASGVTVWTSATHFEVYALGLLLFLLAFLAFLKAAAHRHVGAFYIGVFVLGLGLANHASIIAIVPLALLAWWRLIDRLKFRGNLLALSLLLMALSAYLYLPYRSSQPLVLDWYDPASWDGLKQHLLAHPYRQYLLEPRLGDLFPYVLRVLEQIASEWSIPFTILALPGLFIIIRKHLAIGLAFTAVAALNVAINFLYGIPDITPYFLPTMAVLAIGTSETLFAIPKLPKVPKIQPAIWAIFLAGVSILGNFARADISDRVIAAEYAQALLDQVPPNGLLLCGTDYTAFPAFYYRYVENHRPDITVCGQLPTQQLLRNRLNISEPILVADVPRYLPAMGDSLRQRIVFSREPMRVTVEAAFALSELHARGLVYSADSSLAPTTFPVTRTSELPEIFDVMEAGTNFQLLLIAAEDDRRDLVTENRREIELLLDRLGVYSLRNELGEYLVLHNYSTSAQRVFSASLADPRMRTSDRLRALLAMGTIQRQQENVKAARNSFNEILSIDPQFPAARFHIAVMDGEVAESAGDFITAAEKYSEALSAFPNDPEMHFRLGRLALKLGDHERAEQFFAFCLKTGYRRGEIENLRH